MTLPTFVIAGAAKSGTSSLARMLNQHPDVFVTPHKEPHYFLFPGRAAQFRGPGDENFNAMVVPSWEDYQGLFADAGSARAVGEASVFYLAEPDCFARMAAELDRVKAVLVLRNPVDRAFSAFSHMTLDKREPLASFSDALAAEPERSAAGWEYIWRYRELGVYADQLEALYRHVPRERVLLVRYDDFRERPGAVLAQIFAFLDVDPTFSPDLGLRINVSGKPRSERLHAFITEPRVAKSLLRRVVPTAARRRVNRRMRNLNLRPTGPDPATAVMLREYYRPSLLRLEQLTGWDLSDWIGARDGAASGSRAAP